MPPSVSVVVPARNDAVALRRCLTALAAQSLPPLEVVVVDNASQDDTAAVAAAHGARVVTEPVVGIPAAAATGYDAAVGDVVVRCDADTVLPPDWLERVAAAFAAEPDLQALTGWGSFYGVGRVRAVVVGRLYLWGYFLAMHAALAHPPLWGSAMAVRRACWQAVRDRVHRDDQELHDDVDLSFALDPRVGVRHDRTLRVLVHGRSLDGGAAGRRRWVRAVRTLHVGWTVTPPWRRWAVRLSGRSADAGPAAGR